MSANSLSILNFVADYLIFFISWSSLADWSCMNIWSLVFFEVMAISTSFGRSWVIMSKFVSLIFIYYMWMISWFMISVWVTLKSLIRSMMTFLSYCIFSSFSFSALKKFRRILAYYFPFLSFLCNSWTSIIPWHKPILRVIFLFAFISSAILKVLPLLYKGLFYYKGLFSSPKY